MSPPRSTAPTAWTPWINIGPQRCFWEKDAAEKAAKRVFGVRGVANDIEVKLFWKRTDPEIARDVVRELDSHVSIPVDRIKVTVKDGWATLEGTVDWEYQKKLAISAVKKAQRCMRRYRQNYGEALRLSKTVHRNNVMLPAIPNLPPFQHLQPGARVFFIAGTTG
jgi:hypothetical protein